MHLLTFESLSLFLVLGSLAGFTAGLFGIGGGVILVPLFLWAFEVAGFSSDLIVHMAFGTSLAIIVPTAFSSTLGHRKRGNVDWHQVVYLGLAAIFGAVMGAMAAVNLPGEVLKALFGIMQVGVGLKMFLYHPHLPPEERKGIAVWKFFVVGGCGGFFSAFFGIGGGVVAVPLMVVLLRLPIHLAVGNSSALVMVSALWGTLCYLSLGWSEAHLPPFSLGYVNLLVAVLVAPLSMIFARVGARVASHTRHDRLMKIFAVFLIFIGLRIAYKVWF
ncbi:sulfite exporter TauE/SafE family protein [Geoalkalibacter subterraneus]|uniref:sulfite exporter TauE/SafE family protein n=1 Tax=Geoalkalibacter subterraneus TaxID=483547 RepID=UPI000693F8D6|nr:sulfite exporter TauE/SafE family protein [Geoalkalibacter subterraneus]